MKKLILLALVLIMAVMAFADVVIGSGTSLQYYPMSNYYNYNRSAAIYKASEIGATGTITNLKWYCGTANTTTTFPIAIYLKHTAAATLAATTWAAESTGATAVYSATIAVNATGWFNFDITDFAYNGTDNLEVLVESGSAAYVTPYVQMRYTATATNMYAMVQADGTVPTALATSLNRPNITFVGITNVNPPNPCTLVSPTNGSYALIGQTLNWAPASTGAGATAYDVYFDTTGGSTLVSNDQVGTTYTPTLAANTTYYWKVIPSNTYGEASGCPVWNFKTPTATQLAESFEGASFPPAGWANPGTWASSTSYAKNGTKSAYKYGSSSTQYILSTPKVTITGTSNFNIWTLVSGTTGTLQVVYSLDRTTWTQIGSNITHAATYTWYNTVVDLSSLAGNNYYLGVRTGLQGVSYYTDMYVGPEITPEAPGPVTLSLPADAATLVNEKPTFTWTAPTTGGAPTGYAVYCSTTNPPNYNTELIGSTTGALTFTATTALAYSTPYYWTVKAYNGAGDATMPAVRSFTTRANPTVSTFPTVWDFGTLAGDAFPPVNWNRYSGVLASPTVLGAAGTGNWGQDDWLNVTTPANKAGKINIYSTFNGWLVTPPIAVPAAGYEVKFDVAYMAYGSNAAPATTGTDDQFAVLIGNGTSWTPANVVRQWDNAGSPYVMNSIPPAGMTVSLPFGAAGTYYVAFYGISTTLDADNDLMVDNIEVRETPAAPIFTLSPSVSSWDFGQTVINTAATKQFTISNTGGGTLNLSSVVATGTYYSISVAPTDMALTAGESTTFTVQYLPTSAVGSPHAGTVTINDDRAATPITLSGSCVDPTIYSSSLPYTQGFEGVTAPAMPVGWTSIDNNVDGDKWITSTTNPRTGVNCARLYTDYNTANDDYLVTPAIQLTGNQRLKFWARAQSTTETDEISVLLSTTTPTAAAFTNVVMASTPITLTTYTQFTVDLSAYTGMCYVSFTRNGTPVDGYYLHVDDVLIEDIPTTPIFGYAPTTIAFGTALATNPTAYQNVTVTNNGEGTLNLTAADISLIGTDPTEFGFTTTTGFPAALTAGQSVTIPVRFAPTTVGAKTATLRIVYDAANYDVALTGNALPETALFEGFEGTTFPPADWTVTAADAGGTQTWTRLTTGQRTGVACASIGYESAAHDDWLITPKLAITASDYTFSFWAMNSGTYFQEKFNVLVSTLTNGVADFTNVIATGVAPGAAYSLYSYDLSAFAGSNVYVGIQATETNQLRMWIDDVTGPSRYIAVGVPDPVTLTYPTPSGATGLPKAGFNFTWTRSETGGTPTSYCVYMATDEGTMFDEYTWLTTNTYFNPVTDGGVTFNYLDYYYWTVKAINNDGDATVDPAWNFEIEADPATPVAVFPYTMNFEANGDNSLPSRWTRTSLATGWEFGNALWSEYWDVPDHTVYAAANDDAAGSTGDGSMDLLYGPHFDFSGADTGIPILSFDSFYNGAYSEIATVEVCTNGVDWTVLKTLAANTAWVTLSQNLADYDGMSDVQFRFHADDAGEWSSGWAIDNFSVDYVNIDMMEPVVDHYPIIGVPLLNTSLEIVADVTDDLVWNSGIVSATLHYTINGGTVVDVAMTNDGSLYSAMIPGQVAGTLVAYYITAVDASAQANTVTSATWDFYIDSPVWMQYDSNTVTNNLGLSTGTFGIMTGFENPFGAGNPCQINSVFGRFNGATTANVHVYTYDSGTDTFTDVIPSFAQSFSAATDTTIPLTGCVTTASYFYVAYTDVVGPMYFALDETQTYYPGTHFLMFGAGMSTADLGTIEGSGYPGAWLLRANVQAGSTALETPVVSIAADGTLSWPAVTGATMYTIYSSADPYAETFDFRENIAAMYTSWLDPTFGADKMFYQVKASDAFTPPSKNAAATRIGNLRSHASRTAQHAPKAQSIYKNRK